MKQFTLIVCFILLSVLLITAAPGAATTTTIPGTDGIASISPHVGYANGKTMSYIITGTNFTTAGTDGEVWLEMTDQTNIPATITNWSDTKIGCTIRISSSRERGSWNLVVKKSYTWPNATIDTNYIVRNSIFTVADPMELTSITPATGQMGNDSVDFTIVGTGLGDVEDVFLFNEDYTPNLTADIASNTDTKIKGSFDLTDGEEDTYKVCVKDSLNTITCDLSYAVTTDKVGKLDISSNPSGATIYLDDISNGTTPRIISNIPAGSHYVSLKKAGYQDWGKTVSIKDGSTSEIDTTLYALATATAAPTASAAATSRPTTARTTAKSTIKVPTTYADIPDTTTASPLDPAVVIGAAGIGIGLATFRRR